MQTIQATITARASHLGLTAYALAKITGISTETIRRFFAGEQDMTGQKLDKLLDALGLELREINQGGSKGR
jgi:transcriptional regulator with XRE-family HTH domain